MKQFLIATTLAGAFIRSFATLSSAAPLSARLNDGNAAIINVAEGCGPYAHRERFHDRFGRKVWGRWFLTVLSTITVTIARGNAYMTEEGTIPCGSSLFLFAAHRPEVGLSRDDSVSWPDVRRAFGSGVLHGDSCAAS